MAIPDGITSYRVSLGMLRREGVASSPKVTSDVANLVPVLEAHIAAGAITPLAMELVPGSGWEAVIDGLGKLAKGGGSNAKLVVKVC